MSSDPFGRPCASICGLPFDSVGMQGAIERVGRSLCHQTPLFISTPNLNFLIGAQQDWAFRDSVIHSDLSIVDGMPLVWVARLLGLSIRERVAGSSLFEALRNGAAGGQLGRPVSVFFFGGPPGVAEKAAQVINADGRHMICSGFYCPGFGSVEEMSGVEVIKAINASAADFLVVALGAKKGQAWIEHNRRCITVPVISHLGAVVNFVAGTVQRAPVGWQRLGLEWLWRIREEPGLFRRYWKDGLAFLGLLLGRVLPYAIWLRLHQPLANESGSISRTGADGEIVFSFHGVVDHKVLSDWRDELQVVDGKTAKVTIDLSRATYLGPDFFGLLMLLKKKLDERVADLSVQGHTTLTRRLFYWNCLNW